MKVKDNSQLATIFMVIFTLIWLLILPNIFKFLGMVPNDLIHEKMFYTYIGCPGIIIVTLIFLSIFMALNDGDYIYEDRLEHVLLSVIYNVVYFKDIIRVKETTRPAPDNNHYDVYIFDDGRKDNKYDGQYKKSGKPKYNNEFSFGPFKYNYQTNKCDELTDFINNKLKIPIIKTDRDGEVIEDEK